MRYINVRDNLIRKFIISLITFSVLIIIASGTILAEERSIFVGDLIKLRFSTELSSEELKDRFKDFEIVDFQEKKGDYILTLRSFEPGEKTIQLGNNKLKIIVKSTLDEIDRDSIYEGDLTPAEPGFGINWFYISYILAIIFIILAGISLWQYLKIRKDKNRSPYQLFKKRIAELSLERNEYLVILTRYFKEYLEKSFTCRIRGKTSIEILSEIRDISELQKHLTEIEKWLRDCDYFKFSGVTANTEEKDKMKKNLNTLVDLIEVKEP